MNTKATKAALKTLLETNVATLVAGLEAQGEVRSIEHISTSVLTPAKGYFFIALHQTEADDHSRIIGSMANTSTPLPESYHNIVVHIEDYAIASARDDELFEEAHENFDDFVDRIVALIRAQTAIGGMKLLRSTDPSADRNVRRSDALQQWSDEAEKFHAMLYAQLSFILVEC